MIHKWFNFCKKAKTIAYVLSSLRFTSVLLLLLAILTFWGTLYQVQNGIYQAQQRFFHSWALFVGGVLPFPGVKTVLSLMCLNLIFSMLFRIKYNWKSLGIIVIHCGVVVLLAAAGFSYYFAKEAFLTLCEGETSSAAASYKEWQLVAIGLRSGFANQSTIIEEVHDFSSIKQGMRIKFEKFGFELLVDSVYSNTSAADSSGAQLFKEKKPEANPSQNIPAIVLTAGNDDTRRKKVIRLWGGSTLATRLEIWGGSCSLLLRRRPMALPFSVKLVDFVKTNYPATTIARSYESKLHIKSDHLDRQVIVSMNKPFRFGNLTFFQASYSVDATQQCSSFVVVRNSAKWFPYVASTFLCSGLVLHFLIRLLCIIKSRWSLRQ